MDGDHLPYQVLAQVISRRFKLTKNIETINESHFLFIKNWNNKTSNFCMWKLTRLSSLQETKASPLILWGNILRVWFAINKNNEKTKIWRKSRTSALQNIFLTMILLSSDYIWITWSIWYIPFFLYIGSKIYIEKIFSKKYPNNIFNLLQGENILRKKSN